jgi:mannose-6-phosphate isomerase
MLQKKELYPFVFRELVKEVPWGGRRLQTALNKALPSSQPAGESWELVDLPGDQSIVRDGHLTGESLEALIASRGADLLGPTPLFDGRFPLLVKYIDATLTLSVQVHPGRAAARRLGVRSKDEAWYVIDAEPDAVLYLGVRPDVDRLCLERSIRDGSIGGRMRPVQVHPGDLVRVPPGTLHAIGAGILLAEVQQPSDTTYRVYDWERVGLDGRPRPLHLDQALDCTDLDSRPTISRDQIVAESFCARLLELEPNAREVFSGDGPLVVVGLEGSAQLSASGAGASRGEDVVPGQSTNDIPLRRRIALGDVCLVPHVCRPAELFLDAGRTTLARVLVVTFPTER